MTASGPVTPGGGGRARDDAAARSRDTEFFWDGLDAQELRYQVCGGCGTVRHPPRPICAVCSSGQWTALVASGRGSLYSFTFIHHPPVPDRTMPYGVGLIELDEGIRMVGELDGCVADDPPEIGSRVRVRFVTRSGGERPIFEVLPEA